MGEFFNLIIVNPLVNILLIVYQILHFLHIPFALGFSIIGLTVLIRFAIYPLMSSQLKSSKKMQQVAPHISKIKEKHKGDAKRIQQESMRLYKEHGINPAAGCLPVIVQLPIIWGLYSVLQQIVGLKSALVVSHVNKIVYFDAFKLKSPWDLSFFGLSLGQSPSQLFGKIGVLIFLLPVLTGLLQFLLSKMMVPPKPVADEKKIQEKKEKKDDFASAFQSQSTFIFPVMIGFFSFNFPIGLSLYWNTFTIFGIIQQYKILGWGGLSPWVGKIWTKNSVKS